MEELNEYIKSKGMHPLFNATAAQLGLIRIYNPNFVTYVKAVKDNEEGITEAKSFIDGAAFIVNLTSTKITQSLLS